MTRWKVIHSPEIVVLLAAFPFLLRCIFWGHSSLMKIEVPKLTCVLVCTDKRLSNDLRARDSHGKMKVGRKLKTS
jgi:hypothetical protein